MESTHQTSIPMNPMTSFIETTMGVVANRSLQDELPFNLGQFWEKGQTSRKCKTCTVHTTHGSGVCKMHDLLYVMFVCVRMYRAIKIWKACDHVGIISQTSGFFCCFFAAEGY